MGLPIFTSSSPSNDNSEFETALSLMSLTRPADYDILTSRLRPATQNIGYLPRWSIARRMESSSPPIQSLSPNDLNGISSTRPSTPPRPNTPSCPLCDNIHLETLFYSDPISSTIGIRSVRNQMCLRHGQWMNLLFPMPSENGTTSTSRYASGALSPKLVLARREASPTPNPLQGGG